MPPRRVTTTEKKPKKRHTMSIDRAEKILIEHGFSPAQVKTYSTLARGRKATKTRQNRGSGKGTMLLSSLV